MAEEVKVQARFTLEQLLRALATESEGRDLSEYHSVTEWCALLGTWDRNMWRIMREAKARGILEHARVRRPALDGSLRWTNLYAFDLKEGDGAG